MTPEQAALALIEAALVDGATDREFFPREADCLYDAIEAARPHLDAIRSLLSPEAQEARRIGAAVLRDVTDGTSLYLTMNVKSDGWRWVVFERWADEDDDPLREGDGATLDEAAIDAALEGDHD